MLKRQPREIDNLNLSSAKFSAKEVDQMKRFFMLFLGVLCLALFLGGCGKREEPAKAPSPKAEQKAAPAQPEAAKPAAESKEQAAPAQPAEEKPAAEKPAEPKKP
jgi:PBP1b-binding outer membrane lipoprotein LpoB